MPHTDTVDFSNNHIQQEIRDTSVAAWDLNSHAYAAGIIPVKTSERSTGTYWIYDKAYFMSTQVADRQPGTVPPVAKYAVSTATFQIPQKHLSVAITNEEIVESSDTLQPMLDAAMFLGNNFVVDYELDFANTFINDNVWEFQAKGTASSTTDYIDGDVTLNVDAAGAGSFQQFDQLTTSDPINIMLQAIRVIQKETGLRPNKLMIPRVVFDDLRNNDAVMQWALNTPIIQGGDEQVKNILALQLGIAVANIIIVDMSFQAIASIALQNRDVQNANFGQTSTPTFADMEWVIEKSCLLMHSEDSFNKYSRTAAACMKWTGLTDSMLRSDNRLSGGNLGSGVEAPNLLIRGRYAEINFTSYIDGYFAYDNNVISPNLGFYLKDCIA